MGLMEKGKEKTLVGKNKSVVSKLCVLSCMSLWCQALQSPVFPIFQTAIRTGFNLACAAFFILFLLSSFLPYLTLLCCSDLSPPHLDSRGQQPAAQDRAHTNPQNDRGEKNSTHTTTTTFIATATATTTSQQRERERP